MHRRRVVSAFAALVGLRVLPTWAQQAGKTYRIGVLEREPAEKNAAYFGAFKQGLRELGYVEGRNVAFEYRASLGHDDRNAKLAAELVALKVDLVLTRGTPATKALMQATRTIPIVIAGAGDPVADGLVASFAHPGGNVTGFSASTADIAAKRLQLLRELAPSTARVGVLLNMANPNLPASWVQLRAAAETHNIGATLYDVRNEADLRKAFDEAANRRVDSFYVALDGVTQANRSLIGELALKHGVPTIAGAGDHADAGMLAAYGPNYVSLYRGAAGVADKIFKGTKAGDIPVQLPYVFELTINLKTARALNLSVPKDLLARADRVIN